MRIWIYNAGIYVFNILIHISALFKPKSRKWIAGRKDLFSKLQQRDYVNTYWFHCASVGEFEQAYPLIQLIQSKIPSASIFVTFFSPSGYEFALKRYPEFIIEYLPLDTKYNACKFIEIIKPQAVFFIKYEFWFHFLNELKANQIPTFLVAGIFRKEQIFFKWYGKFFQKMFTSFSFFFLQNNESKNLLKSIGFENSAVVGDTRFDRVVEIKNINFQDEIINDFTDNANIFIAGSVWSSDEKALQKIIKQLPIDWKIIIAPHEINNYTTAWLDEEIIWYTKYEKKKSRILILNTLGLLSKVYRKGKLAYIGGGFGKGIHNVLEAAVYEIPIIIGPNYQKFNEAVELIETGIALDISSDEAKSRLSALIQNKNEYQRIQNECKAYMACHTNVSAKIAVLLIDKLLPQNIDK